MKTVHQNKYYRSFSLRNGSVDEKNRTVEASLSSETPCQRPQGDEILIHESDSVDLSRAADGLPLLFGHDPDKPIGIAENVRLDDKKLKATLRFGNSTQANEIWVDVLSGILKKISIGYLIKSTEDNDDGSYRVTNWELFEVSVVGVPADDSIGINRSRNKELNMKQDINVKSNDEIQKERDRIADITALSSMHDSIPGIKRKSDELIRSGKSVNAFRKWILDSMPDQKPLFTPFSYDDNSTYLGMSPNETKNYSITRALNALINNDFREAGFEREASDAISRKLGRKANGIFIPTDVLQSRAPLNTGVPFEGGDLVPTDHLGASFIDLLRNKTQVMNLGATVLTGLQGNVEIPKATSSATGYWVAEDEAITESESTFGQVTLVPKTIGSLTQYTRKMLLQSSPDIEQLVRNDLSNVLAVAIDLAAIAGTGTSNQPTGILNTAGVGLVSIGTDGGAPDYSHVVQLETEVANSNADMGELAYLTNSQVRGLLRVTEKANNTGLFVWEDIAQRQLRNERQGEGRLNGYRGVVSNQVPSNLTKGTGTNLSAIIFGNWADLIVGQWGVLELVVNPYDSTGFSKGNVFVRAMQDIDVAVRHPESFAIITDATTS